LFTLFRIVYQAAKVDNKKPPVDVAAAKLPVVAYIFI
jgi:hypothetical protein